MAADERSEVDPVDRLLGMPAYGLTEAERQVELLEALRGQVQRASDAHDGYGNYVAEWPMALYEATRVADLPYLPVRVFKQNPPLATVPQDKIRRVMLSSSTSGQEPSRIAVDALTARRMTKSVVNILKEFIGEGRRPYLVVDEAATNASKSHLGARGAAIRGLQPFATRTTYVLEDGGAAVDMERLMAFADAHRDQDVLVYGFTTVLWTRLVRDLEQAGVSLNMPRVHVMHSGGWKKLKQEAVSKAAFNRRVAAVMGCSEDAIIDFYGMVENLGVIYPDCTEGNKHVPVTGDIIIRDPLTLEPVGVGGQGLVQACSVLPTSFPGHLLLTDDIGEVIHEDGCPCGRPGLAFRFVGRAARVETRGCGNIDRNPGRAGLAKVPGTSGAAQ